MIASEVWNFLLKSFRYYEKVVILCDSHYSILPHKVDQLFKPINIKNQPL